MGEALKLPEGETFVAMTTTQYGTLYAMSDKGLYRVDLRAMGREMVPVPFRDKETRVPVRDVPDRT